ncbi:Hypothetical protein D9617_19g101560 [Elsinoe fawcettii]|nr:Hypothetical protein D9617_19g101560 [Elsinoe fawcettii]
MQQNSVDDTIANLERLAQKPGVRATLVLSRQSGAIVQSSGLEKADVNDQVGTRASDGAEDVEAGRMVRLKPVEDIARLVFEYVTASGKIAKEMNTSEEDEMRLLRMRTKSNELVIVPDAHYIAVVIHDTPPA